MTPVRAVAGLAARAAVPVYPLVGEEMQVRVQRLHLDSRVRLVDSPRHATVLLVAGRLPPGTREAAARVHDALPRPRATLWWMSARDDLQGGGLFGDAVVVPADGDVGAALVRVHRELMLGDRPGEGPLLPDEDPVPWRGEGPYGHGGTGMTGGVPFGRPLAERDEDLRDGLTLDVVPLTVGPFVPFLPPGLTLRVVFNGDVVHALEVAEPLPAEDRDRATPGGSPTIEAVERARAGHHLRWISWALRVHGLPRLATWTLRLADDPTVGPADLDRLERRLRRSGLFTWHTRRLGRLTAEHVAGSGLGPVARASGVAEDARCDDPAYLALGFVPITRDAGDAAARWLQRLAEARQALTLADQAGQRRVSGRPEPPHGTPAGQRSLLGMLSELTVGTEWGDAVAVVASLDLDLGLAAVRGQVRS